MQRLHFSAQERSVRTPDCDCGLCTIPYYWRILIQANPTETGVKRLMWISHVVFRSFECNGLRRCVHRTWKWLTNDGHAVYFFSVSKYRCVHNFPVKTSIHISGKRKKVAGIISRKFSIYHGLIPVNKNTPKLLQTTCEIHVKVFGSIRYTHGVNAGKPVKCPQNQSEYILNDT